MKITREYEQPRFDYMNQAWTAIEQTGQGRLARVYVRCGHASLTSCDCFGRIHAGEMVRPESLYRIYRDNQ